MALYAGGQRIARIYKGDTRIARAYNGSALVFRAYLDPAQALFDAMTVKPGATRRLLIADTIRDLIAAGVWAKLDLFYVLAAHDEQAARLNWKNPGANTLTAVNSPAFAADQGFTGNATDAYLATGFNPVLQAGQFTQNSAHIGTFVRTTSVSSAVDAGYESSPIVRIRSRTGTEIVNVNNSGGLVADVGDPPMHLMGIRRSSNNLFMFADGVEVADEIDTSSAPLSQQFLILACNGVFVDRQCSVFHIGAALDDTEALAISTIIANYLDAVGAI